MLDIKSIRANAEALKETIKLKKLSLDLDRLLEIDGKRSVLQTKIMELQKERNENAEKMKASVSSKDQSADKNVPRGRSFDPAIVEEGKRIKEDIGRYEDELSAVEAEFHALMVLVPTIQAPDTPIGKDDSENVEVEKWGEIPSFDFPIKDHIELGKSLDILDIERGTKVAGFRGYYLKNEGAQLVMAAMMHAMSKLVTKGFTLMIPPTLIKGQAMYGSGYFKNGEYDEKVDNIYRLANRDEEMDGKPSSEQKFLVGTAEPSLLAYYSDEVVDLKNGPIKMAGFSQCYRSEIGDYGRDTKGIYRVHEFFKVEQVVIAEASIEATDAIQQEMLEISKELHRELGLPYRLLRMCTGDLGTGKYKQFDMEAWIPSRNGYGETGSASNFLDWQARRLNVKYVDAEGNRKVAYMLNNTALASARTLIAILENHQQSDGSVIIPEVLRPYMGGKERIIPRW